MTDFRFLADFASDAAFGIGSDSQIVAWNRRAESLLGYTREQTLGRPCYDVLRATLPGGAPLCTPECEGKLCFGLHLPFAVRECSLRHRDGQWLRGSISSLIAYEPDGKDDRTPAVAVVFLKPADEPACDPAADRKLRISTFGRFSLSVADRALPIERWYRKHALTLLKLLITHHGEAVHFERVIECLWPDANERRGRERLKVVTYFLRRQLSGAGVRGDLIVVANAACALRRDALWLDCEVFEGLFDEGRRLEQRGWLKEALACFDKAERLYTGDYLAEERYSDWCAQERERLREIHFDVLGHLVDGHVEAGDNERAAQLCRLALSREPCRESFHRMLMICLLRLGQRDQAIAQYHRCRQLLKAELDVAPASETESVYRELFAAGASPLNSV